MTDKDYKVRVIIPTRLRPKKLLKAVHSIPEWVSVCVECHVQSEDLLDIEFRRPVNIKEDTSIERDETFVKAVNRNCIKGYSCIVSSDDIYYEDNAIETALECMKEKFPDTDGVIGFNVYNMPGQSHDGAVTLVGDKFLNRFENRQMFCPQYLHFYVDTELAMYAKKVDKFFWCKDAKVYHEHPSVTGRPDATHKYKRDYKHNHDSGVFSSRQDRGLLWGKV